MKKWIIVSGFVGLLTACAFLAKTARGLRIRVREINDSRRRLCVARYCPSPAPTTYAEKMLFISACEKVKTAVRTGEIHGLADYRDFLATHDPNITTDNAEALGDAMRKTFHENFLFAKELQEFESQRDFANYAYVNFTLAMYFGELDIRRGSYESPLAIEYLSYDKFKRYVEMFHAKSRPDLERIAMDYLCHLIKHIESGAGFTRLCIRHQVLLNTECAEIMSPGRGLSNRDGILLGRAYARGLIKAGYTPKWLDTDYPDPDAAKRPVARPSH